MCGSMVDIQSPAAEIRQEKKEEEEEEEEGTGLHRATIITYNVFSGC